MLSFASFYSTLDHETNEYDFVEVDFYPLKHLVGANQLIFDICQTCSLCLNACLCIDLYITFKDPFKPSGKRLKFYFIFTGVIVTIVNYYNYNQSTFLLAPETFFEQYIQPTITDYLNGDADAMN